jgi:hypothetical protein
MSTKTVVTFKPKQVVKRLLSALSDRSVDVIVKRYGLEKDLESMTLDAIGKTYGITRERVRQIENHALGLIRKSKNYAEEKQVFDEIAEIIQNMGGIVEEQTLLDEISKDKTIQNYTSFLLVLGNQFKKLKEDEEFGHRWYIEEDLASNIHNTLRKLFDTLKMEDLVSEQEIIKMFLENYPTLSEQYKNSETVKGWLSLSKKIDKNPLGEWGRSESPNVCTKGMRDYAYLVIRKHGSPIHFREVAKEIVKVFDKKAHVATCHNELIKDPRFVLVGRGLYALSEWGYMSGVVKDVIKKIIEKSGPLTKKEIVEKVLKERYVKENTIVINLQNPKFFKKGLDGKYSIVK